MLSATRTSAMILAATGVAALAAGCGGGTPTASDSSASSGPPSSSAAPTPAGTGSPTGAAGPDRCHTAGLGISARGLGAAAGNHYAVVTFTNTTNAPCRVYGYPGLQLLTSQGGLEQTNVVRDPASAPALVTLAPNAVSFSQLHWGAVPGNGDTNSGPCQNAPAKTEVTPPDETANKVIPWPFGIVCEKGTITVTSLRAGTGPTE
jgi:hypothetical protein